jgi:hypothetical protein
MVGNTVVCFIVARNKHMHTVTNLFIFNLAISDLLVGIFCMPITLLDNIIAGMLTCVQYKEEMRKCVPYISEATAGSFIHKYLWSCKNYCGCLSSQGIPSEIDIQLRVRRIMGKIKQVTNMELFS